MKEKVCFYNNDNQNFIKLGNNIINEIFDIKATLDLLRLLNIRGSNLLTATRKEYINKRIMMNTLSEISKDNADIKNNDKDDNNFELSEGQKDDQKNDKVDEQNEMKEHNQ